MAATCQGKLANLVETSWRPGQRVCTIENIQLEGYWNVGQSWWDPAKNIVLWPTSAGTRAGTTWPGGAGELAG